jgi:tartrate-resistant acid phosphatase type 5
MIKRTLGIKLCIWAWLCAGWIGGLQAAEAVHFLITGDTGSGLEQQKQVAEAVAQYADRHQGSNGVNFIILTGDNFYNDGVKTVDDPQWQQKFEKMYDAKRLPMPFIAVLGNHDWRNDQPDVEIEYAKAHPGTRWQMDGHWFKRQFPAQLADRNAAPLAEFFFVDTQAWSATDTHVSHYKDKHLGDKQMAWLEAELKKSQARWKIVVAHHPLYSNGEHGHDTQITFLRGRLGPLFKQRKVDAFITGHDHDLQRIVVPGEPTLFLISGAGSKLRPRKYNDWKPFHASAAGFAAIHLSETEMRGEFIDVNGKTLDTWHRKPLSSR